MNLNSIKPVCYHLHRFFMSPIAPDVTDVRASFINIRAIDKASVGLTVDRRFDKDPPSSLRCLVRRVQSDDRQSAAQIAGEEKIEHFRDPGFPFNGGSLNSFISNQLDSQLLAGTGYRC